MNRFTTRQGCYLYGKLRRTDFLPVGGGREDEVLERGVLSASSASDSEGSMSGGTQHVGSSALAGDMEDCMTYRGIPPLEGALNDFC